MYIGEDLVHCVFRVVIYELEQDYIIILSAEWFFEFLFPTGKDLQLCNGACALGDFKGCIFSLKKIRQKPKYCEKPRSTNLGALYQ